MKIVDLSHPIYDQMPVYPGDATTHLVQTRWVEQAGYSIFEFDTSMHAGTHIDAPSHLIAGGESINEIPAELFIGNATLLDVRGQTIIGVQPEYQVNVKAGDIVLFLSGWDRHYGKPEYYREHPEISEALVDFLLEKQVRLIGLDTPSPDRPPFKIHQKLLAHHILIIENLTRLDQLLAFKRFEIIALPLKIHAEASLVRVVAREIEMDNEISG